VTVPPIIVAVVVVIITSVAVVDVDAIVLVEMIVPCEYVKVEVVWVVVVIWLVRTIVACSGSKKAPTESIWETAMSRIGTARINAAVKNLLEPANSLH